MKKLRLVLTGSARSATKFYAQYLTDAGLHCGHERFFSLGGLEEAQKILAQHWFGTFAESSWLAAPFLDREELADALVVHLTRHPKRVVESMLRQPPGIPYYEFRSSHIPHVADYRSPLDRAVCAWIEWNQLVEELRPDAIRFDVAREPRELLEILIRRGFEVSEPEFDDRNCNHHTGPPINISLSDVEDEALRGRLVEWSARYGYEWPAEHLTVSSPPVVKAVVTTLDNLDNLVESLPVLLDEPLAEIVVVNNGSVDGTTEWLASQPVRTINRENFGAGPGRNAGLDAAGEFDYVLMLDGGIRPLCNGVGRMLDYLRWTPGADVIGVEIADLETDREKAWRRWSDPITKTYHNTRLSHTAYCLCRKRAWDGLRFCEEGPFGEPGWGADDDEMAYRWNVAGVVVHVTTGIHPYRRAGGSYNRLYSETGIWPNQYGSVFEKRLVWLQQNWPQYQPGVQWGEPWLTVVIAATNVDTTARLVKHAHDALRERKFAKPYDGYPNPYSVVVWGGDDEWQFWAEPRRLRQHHGDTVVLDEYGPNRQIVRRGPENETTWTGDFRLWAGDDWHDAIRPGAFYYGLATTETELASLVRQYDALHPPRLVNIAPTNRRVEL